MKKLAALYVAVLLLLACAVGAAAFAMLYGDGGARETSVIAPARAADEADNGEGNIPDSIDDLLSRLELEDMQGLLGELDEGGIAAFGFGDIAERVRAVANGEYDSDAGGILGYVLGLFGAEVFEFMPMLLSVLAIILAYNMINSVKSRCESESVERVVYYATGALALCLVVGYFSAVLASAVKFVASVKAQVNAVSPVILTLMTAAGAGATASTYSPTVAILGSGMTNIITYLAFPALLMGLVFDIIGSVSTSIRLSKTADFFRSACKWFLGTAFFVFIAVIGVSGITASVRDGISVRAARFAVSKYVPVIGGYLSQGFDFVVAGNVLIKNAVGSSAVILMILAVAPVVARLAIFTLTLRLTAAIAQPLGGERFSDVLTSIAKSSSMLAAVVIAMAFLYVLFLAMLVGTGNVIA